MDPLGIVLLGQYYAGKTTTAMSLGSLAGFTVLDLDEIYDEEYRESIWVTRARDEKENTSHAVSQRDRVGERILDEMVRSPSICVFGGGSFLRDRLKDRPDTIERMKDTHFLVCLAPTIEALTHRIMHGGETAEVTHYYRRKDPVMIAKKLDEDFRDHGPLNLSWSDAVVQPETGWSAEKVDLEVIRKFMTRTISRYKNANSD